MKYKLTSHQEDLQEGYDKDTLSIEKLKAISNARINTNLKEQGFKDGSLKPMDYLNDIDVPKDMIIKYEMEKIKKENKQNKKQLAPEQVQAMRESFAQDVVNKGLYENLKKYMV